MPKPPRRRRFQIHLSTAIVMMFVAGVLIWANTRGRRVETIGRYIKALPAPQTAETDARDKEMAELNPGLKRIGTQWATEKVDGTEADFLASANGDFWCGNRDFQHGWPCDALYSSTTVKVTKSEVSTDGVQVQSAAMFLDFENPRPNPIKEWLAGALVVNALVALGILLSAAILCEWLIRRRAAQ